MPDPIEVPKVPEMLDVPEVPKMLDVLRLPLRGSRLIEASAGTGKTWTIAALYLRLVLGHGDDASRHPQALRPAQILVMTFTRAATRELAERIRARLVEATACFRGQAEPSSADTLLQDLLADYPAGPEREAAAWRLGVAAEAMDEAAVHTIDAWCQRMLREHAFDSGSLFDEELGADETALLTQAVHDFWRAQVYPLTAEPLAAVLQRWPSVTHLARDVAGLLRYVDHLPPAAHCAPASLARCWEQAQADWERALAALKVGWVARLAALCDWLLGQLDGANGPFNKKKLAAFRVQGWFDALGTWAATPGQSQPDWTATARQRLTPAGLDEVRSSPGPLMLPADFEALEQLMAALDAMALPADALRLHAARQVAQRVRELKAGSGVYGFADMLERLDLALAGPNAARLRERIVAQYPVALIDEFQDSAPRQFRIFDALYRTAANDPATALFLIGDPKQSIYAFRGADIRSYLAARRATTGRRSMLGTNFRATTALVAVVNGLFEQAEMRAGVGAFRFRRGTDDPLPFVPVAAQGRAESLVCAAGGVPALTVCHAPQISNKSTAQSEFAQHCAEHIVGLLNDQQAGFAVAGQGGSFKPLRPADIAVLVRNGSEADAVRHALRQRGVAAVYLSDQDSVLASIEAADLLLWLQAVADPTDHRTARAALATATLALPLTELASLVHDDAAFEQHCEQLRQLRRVWQRQGVLPMLRQTLHRLGLPARWLAQQADGERRLTNVLHLAELLQAASAKLDGEQALIRWLAAELADLQDSGRARSDEQVLRLESDADLVKLVTVHKAKGLEYPVVCLPFATAFRPANPRRQGFAALPGPAGSMALDFRLGDHALAAAEEERLQEDLRLLYVALTRARHALWLGVASLKIGISPACVFHRSALGRLLAGDTAVGGAAAIAPLLQQAFGGWAQVDVQTVTDDDAASPRTRTRMRNVVQRTALPEARVYTGRFERDWGIGSFSSLVRDLAAGLGLAAAGDGVLPAAMAEELLTTAADLPAQVPTDARADALSPINASALAIAITVATNVAPARHRFARGALAGNFLHEQLEWLADARFAVATDPTLAPALRQRCERQGYGPRADEVVEWLGEVAGTPLPPVGAALNALDQVLPEMEFWFAPVQLRAAALDRVCQTHLLGGRPRPALPERRLHGFLMGFADLVFEHQGRYWVLDYKSNALGDTDAHYTTDALEAAMAQHRYDVQAALYLLALHRLLRARLGAAYQPAQQLGGAVYFFLRGVKGPAAGCYHVAPDAALLAALDHALASSETSTS